MSTTAIRLDTQITKTHAGYTWLAGSKRGEARWNIYVPDELVKVTYTITDSQLLELTPDLYYGITGLPHTKEGDVAISRSGKILVYNGTQWELWLKANDNELVFSTNNTLTGNGSQADPLSVNPNVIATRNHISKLLKMVDNGDGTYTFTTQDGTETFTLDLANAGPVDSVNGQTGEVELDTDDVSEGSTNLYYTDERVEEVVDKGYVDGLGVDAATLNGKSDFVEGSEKGVAGGVATLNAQGKLSNSQVPAIAITETFEADDIAERDQLTTGTGEGVVGEGDVVIVTDATGDPGVEEGGASYIYDGTEYKRLIAPTDAVSSVNGQKGVVVLDTDDIDEGAVNKYYTEQRVSANTDVAANTTARHTHSNKALLDSYNQTNANITAAVAHKDLTNNPHGVTAVQAGVTKSYVDGLGIDAVTLNGEDDYLRPGDDVSELQNDVNYVTQNATLGLVIHGSNSSAARPTGFNSVMWIGEVEPDNADENDIWVDDV